MSWTISYHNLSSKPLHLSHWGGQYQVGLSEESHLPKSLLEPGQKDYLQMDQDLSTLDHGPNEYWQAVVPTSGGQSLFVRVVVPFQLLFAGYSPYWNFALSPGGVPGDWGVNYQAESPSTAFDGLKVSFSATHSHSEVAVQAVFEDA